MSGPLPLALRLIAGSSGGVRSRSLRRRAALFGIAGSLLTRYGWVYAGRCSARDWRLPLEILTVSSVIRKHPQPKPKTEAAS
jgi:hypothetical protein